VVISYLGFCLGFLLPQKEEERQRQVEKRKKERQKVVAKKRNLESLAKDAKKRAEDFNRRVSDLRSISHAAGDAPYVNLKRTWIKVWLEICFEAGI